MLWPGKLYGKPISISKDLLSRASNPWEMHYLDYLEGKRVSPEVRPPVVFQVKLPRIHIRFPGLVIPEPTYYPLKLVQAAVALGASAIRIFSEDSVLRFEADGCVFPDGFDLSEVLMRFPEEGSALTDLTVG